jgi:Uma2 family endonuclease
MATRTDPVAVERVLPRLPPPDRALTVADLEVWFPDETRGVELLDGVLLVTPPPHRCHTEVAFELAVRLRTWCVQHGGRTLVAPTGMQLADDTLLEPDVLVLDAEQADALTDDPYVSVPPRLVVEVSSPGTRRRDLGMKRDAYQRFGVAEYWFVDLERRVVLVDVRDDRGFVGPRRVGPGETLVATTLPGFEVPVDDVLAPR